ncbi:hypothetical protein Dsin_018080 [Dipteronia sinensis]|uniref:Strictosidine synthase conserved region domain-containing protein n=1 Tax=Dipteronia sinensis TaxID=43782 RepID=A0AAE0AGI2_9ROSI|nr:hypothetical protein Dsin_018080 [Dipteronia sinensis]
MAPRRCVSACSGFLVACLLAFTLQIIFFSPISPDLLELPPPSSSASHLLPTNTHLQRVIKLGEGYLKDPEDVCVNSNGVLYTATRDGWVKRLHKNGTWQDWKFIDTTHALLGITTTMENELIVCDAEKLLKVNEDGVVTVLASHVNGSKIRFTDDVIEASDGSLYFSVASTKFEFDNLYLDVLEAKPEGQQLKYDPSSYDTSTLLDHLGCANENLPGGPDNINLAPDDSFWIAILEYSSNVMDFVHTSKASKHLLAAFPKLFNLINPMCRKAMVINVAADGSIIKKFQDPTGKVMSFVTSAFEFQDHLYLGSLNSNFIGKLPLQAE